MKNYEELVSELYGPNADVEGITEQIAQIFKEDAEDKYVEIEGYTEEEIVAIVVRKRLYGIGILKETIKPVTHEEDAKVRESAMRAEWEKVNPGQEVPQFLIDSCYITR